MVRHCMQGVVIVVLALSALAGLSLVSRVWAQDQAKAVLPATPGPYFFIVLSVNKEGAQVERVRPPTKEVDPPRIVFNVKFKDIGATDARGKALDAAELSRRLKPGSVVLVSDDERQIDPVYLSVVRDETVVLTDVFPRKGATGVQPAN